MAFAFLCMHFDVIELIVSISAWHKLTEFTSCIILNTLHFHYVAIDLSLSDGFVCGLIQTNSSSQAEVDAVSLNNFIQKSSSSSEPYTDGIGTSSFS